MASTRSTIEIEIRAAVESFRDATRGAIVQLRLMAEAVKENDKAFERVGKGIRIFLTSLAKVGSIVSAVQLVAGITAAFSNLLPILFIAPGLILGIGAAFATIKLATAGFADALKGDADALAKLAPSARALVEQINALKPAFDGLRRSVQQNFFANFAGDLKNITTAYLPILEAKLPRIAAAFNDMGRSITRALLTNGAPDDVNIVLTNMAKLLENARNALGHLVAGFIPLAAVGSTYIPAIGTAIDAAADRFRAWSLQVTSDGSLRNMIDGAIAGFGLLRDSIRNIGDIIGAVFGGLSQGAGKDFLQTLADSTDALATFLAQAEQQEALGALGKALSDIAQVTRDVFLEALRQLAPIITELAPVFSEIATVVGALLVNALKIVGPLLLDVARFLNDNKEIIADLTPLVLGLWVAFKGASILTGVATALGPIVTRLGGLAGLLKIGGFVALGAIAVDLDKINKATQASEGRGPTDMEDTLSNIVGAGRELLTLNFEGIFGDIADEWQQVVDGFTNGTSPIGAAKDFIVDFAVKTGESFAQIGTFVADFISTTGQSFATIGTAIADGFTTAVTAVSDFFTVTIPGLVSTGLGAIGDLFGTIGTTIQDSFLTPLQTAGQAVVDFFNQTPYEIGFAIGAVIGEIIQFGIDLVTNLVNAATTAGTAFLDTVTTWFNNAITFLTTWPGQAIDAIIAWVTGATDTATQAGQGAVEATTTWFDNAVTFLAEFPGKALDAIVAWVQNAVTVAVNAGTQFVQTLTTWFNNAVEFLRTFPGKALDAIIGVVQNLITAATQAGKGFLDTITTWFNNAVEFVRGIPGKIVAAIGNLGGLLVNAGKSLMDGLLDGIKSAYNGLIDFVSGIAGGIAAHKGPLSYDKIVLRPAGLALMDGLLGGLRDGNDTVQAFVAGIAAQLADPFGATPSTITSTLTRDPVARMSSAVGDAIVGAMSGDQAISVNVFLDGQPFRAMVTSAIVEQDREIARVVRNGGGTSW